MLQYYIMQYAMIYKIHTYTKWI